MVLAYIKMGLRWLAATGTGALTVALTYMMDSLGAIDVDITTTTGIVLLLVVTGGTKLISWLVAKIPKGDTGDPPA
jgi:hypothetical protein